MQRIFEDAGVSLELNTVLAVFLGVGSVLALLTRFQHLYVIKFEADLTRDLRQKLMAEYLSTGWSQMTRYKPADLTNLVIRECERAGLALTLASNVTGGALVVISYLIWSALISGPVTVTTLTATGFILFFLRRLVISTYNSGEIQSQKALKLTFYLSEILSSLKTIKAHGQEQPAQTGFEGSANEVATARTGVARSIGWIRAGSEILSYVFLAISIGIAVQFFGITGPSLLVLAFLMMRSLPRLKEIQSMAGEFLNYLPSFEEVQSFISDQTQQRNSGDKQFGGTFSEIKLSDVSHSYGNRKSLSRVSFSIRQNHMVGICGSSGGGKTTLLDLLLDLQPPQEGQVLVDNVPLEKINADQWRKHLSYVAQDAVLFNDSIFNNLVWANPSASVAEIEDACRIAHAHDFISQFPEKYHTIVGDRGSKLSGGQRQRIALARALLRKPTMLFLDEVTSALDTESTNKIIETLENLRGKMTIIMVTHDLELLKNCDNILVVEGQILESGLWSNLAGSNGRFSQLLQREISI